MVPIDTVNTIFFYQWPVVNMSLFCTMSLSVILQPAKLMWLPETLNAE